MGHRQEENAQIKHQVIRPKSIPSEESFGTPTIWLTYSFAPEWFKDALNEARTGQDHHSRRREIVFSVCFVESYLFEWVRDEILNRKFDELAKYFPDKDRQLSTTDRWKAVIKRLHKDNRIQKVPNFGDSWWRGVRTLVEYRNGLVHAGASRPETDSLRDDEKPVPSKTTLDQLEAGWAVRVVIELIRRLHEAAGTSTPAWLIEP